MDPSPVGALPPPREVELLGNIYRYISQPTGFAGEDFAPAGVDLSPFRDIDRGDVRRRCASAQWHPLHLHLA